MSAEVVQFPKTPAWPVKAAPAAGSAEARVALADAVDVLLRAAGGELSGFALVAFDRRGASYVAAHCGPEAPVAPELLPLFAFQSLVASQPCQEDVKT